MRKQIIMAFSLILCLLFVASFSGCINQDEELTPTIKRIKNAGELVVGTCAPLESTFEPIEYINGAGVIVGFDIDFASEIASELDVELKVLDEELKEKLDELERFKKSVVGRELQMIKLKERIKEFEGELEK